MTTVRAVVREIGAELNAAEPDTAEEQLELLPPTRFKTDGDGFDRTAHGQMVASVRRDRAGRPPGAKNVATRDAVAFIRRLMGDPLIESARWAMHTPESLARELDCSKLEAFDRLEKIRADLRRFVYAPMSPVDDQGNVVPPQFNLVIGGGNAAVVSAGGAPWEYLKPQQNQSLGQPAGDVSHAELSHGVAK